MSISERLFGTAIQDLNAVEVLYESNYYNLALFHLQQSVEKFVKSFGIRTKIITPEDMVRKINHLPHKVFTRLCQNQMEELSKYNETLILIPDMVLPRQKRKIKTKENLGGIKNFQTEIFSKAEFNKKNLIGIDDIKKLIKDAKELELEPIFDEDKLFAEVKDSIIKTYEHFIECFKEDKERKSISEHLIKFSDEIARNKVIEYKQIRSRKYRFNYISYVWLNLSMITSPHEQSTRYPSTSNESNPNSLYSLNHNIIKHIPEFVEMMRKAIIKYNELYGN